MTGDSCLRAITPSYPAIVTRHRWLSNQWQFVNFEVLPPSEEDRKFAEGGQKLRLHLVRERDAGVRKYLLRARAATGMSCDICGIKGDHLSEDVRDAMFEAHHASEPMAKGERMTKRDDVALLCACCHRLLHRLVSVQGEWVTVGQAKKLLQAPSNSESA